MYIVSVYQAANGYWFTLGVNLQWNGVQSKEIINDSHLHSTMKTRYKHHSYKYAPHVLEVDLTLNLIISPLNLIIYIPISKDSLNWWMEKSSWLHCWLFQNFYSEKLIKKTKSIMEKSYIFYSFWSFQSPNTNLT